MHKVINFISWCALNFSSKWSIIYFCDLNYRVQNPPPKKWNMIFWPSIVFIHILSKKCIHQVFSWLKLSDFSIQTFSKVDKMIDTCLIVFGPKLPVKWPVFLPQTSFKVHKMSPPAILLKQKVTCLVGDVIKNRVLCCSRPAKFKLIIFRR